METQENADHARAVEIAVATMINKDLKGCITATAKSACECVNPELRNALAQISQDGIRRQRELAKLMERKGYYVPLTADQAALIHLMPQLQAATAGIHAGGGAFTPGVNNAASGNPVRL